MGTRPIRILFALFVPCWAAYGQLPGVSYAISGHIRNAQGQAISNVKVALNTGTSVQTDTAGFYLLAVSANFTGSITPSFSDYTFAPTSRSYTSVLADQSNQDFTGTSTTTTPALTIAGGPLTFTYQIGSAIPASQTFAASISSGNASFSASSSAPTWLQVSPATGTLGTSATTFTVSVTPTALVPNTYSGSITISAPNTSNGVASIGVSLVVSNVPPTPSLVVNGGPLSFNYQNGSSSPPAQTISILTSTGSLNWTATSNESWLQANPLSGTATVTEKGLLSCAAM